MKQSLLKVAAKSFATGAVICLCFYTIIRLMFWNFDFSFGEEMGNLFTIVIRGGLMFTTAAVLFVWVEKMMLRFSLVKIKEEEALPAVVVSARQ